jgi:hypothetical protein
MKKKLRCTGGTEATSYDQRRGKLMRRKAGGKPIKLEAGLRSDEVGGLRCSTNEAIALARDIHPRPTSSFKHLELYS